MIQNALIVETLLFAGIARPIDLQGSSGSHIDGDWINVAHCHRFGFLLYKAIGTAGDDPTLTIQQATSNTGTSAKALTFTTIYTRESTASEGLKVATNTAGQWTKTTQSAAGTYTTATSAESELMWWVEFRTDQLDVTNGFYYVNATIADVGSNAQLGTIFFLGVPRQMLPAASMVDLRD